MLSAVTVVVHTAGLATTILAALGVGLGLLSLGWQARSFYLAGSRVSVEVRAGFMNQAGELMTAPWAPKVQEIAVAKAQGFTNPVFTVVVINSGRSPTSVADVRLAFPDKGSVGASHPAPPLPFRLEGESEQSWVLPMRLVSAYIVAMRRASKTRTPDSVRGQVRVGGRKKLILSRNRVDVT